VRPRVDPRLRVLRRVTGSCIAVYAAVLAARAVGLVEGSALVSAVEYSVFIAVLTGTTVARALIFREDRAAWSCLAAGLTCYLAGFAVYALHHERQLGHPRPSWADVAWMGFYPLVYAALVLMLRARVRQLSASTWLDGLVAGLTAAAVAVAVAVGDVARSSDGSAAGVVASVVYPIADTLLLLLIAGAFTVIGRGAGAAWWWLSAGMACYAGTDVFYALAVADGSVAGSSWLDLGWGAAVTCFGVAALQQPGNRVATRPSGSAGLVVPGLCALTALALLFHGYLHPGDPVAGVLAVGAVLAALTRMTLTSREARALAESRRQARTDELTGLPNRREVYEALGRADADLAAGGRLAVLVIDLNRFKEINDSFGHTAGDALLRQVGPRLTERLRSGDLLGRLGGDEFVVLAPGLDEDEALALADRLRLGMQRAFGFAGMNLTVDASIGVAVGPGQHTSAEELLQLADLAMYAAKAGRDGAALYDDTRHGQARYRLELVEQLRAGIAGGELVLHYQPKLDLRTGRVDAVEALVRWAHPGRGLLHPDAFIDLAESAGLMGSLTSAVLDAALRQCSAWAADGICLGVAVNVSPSNLVDGAFPFEVTTQLARHGVPATRLVLEVTESLLMADRDRAIAVLERLRKAGVGISIDDYGTGYSSLAYLASLPVTELKLDRTFVAAMPGSPRATAVVTSTLQLAQSLGLVLVAEGAEDARTVAALARLDCDMVQGYHISRPLPAEQLETWLRCRQNAVTPV
jgi:diguanylate cyclase (GGDEF)-like protein